MSRLDTYLQHVQGVTGYRRNLSRVNQLTGENQTLLGSQALATHVHGMEKPRIGVGLHSAAGLAAGGIIGAKHGHWALGAISGFSIFTNAPALLKPETRGEAFWNLAQTHGGVIGALAMKDDSSKKKALGFALGYLALGVVRYVYGESK